MQVVVVIPSADWLGSAGGRIRYDRIRPHFERAGHSFALTTLEEAFQGTDMPGDLYLVSKCHDVRALLLIRRLRAAGRAVGVDFFDDYYSQTEDAAFVHLREWFHDAARQIDFAICSTANMQDRLATLAPGLPCHRMNDPAGAWEAAALARTLDRVRERTLSTRQVEIGWFGIGDNPYFSLGLSDLAAFATDLMKCRAMGFRPRLRVLTNRRALDAQRLEMMARLPVPVTIDDWSEEAEQALIADSLFCFLPVNGQEFSTVKSLNRAVSALTGGAQVLSSGFPLYETLTPFIYRDITELLADTLNGTLRLRAETLPQLAALMQDVGSAEVEAGRLMAFLGAIPQPKARPWPAGRPVAVLHGNRSGTDIHQQVQTAGFLSVGTPRMSGRQVTDIAPQVDPEGAYLDLVLSPRAVGCLTETWQRKLRHGTTAKGQQITSIRLTLADLPGLRPVVPPAAPPSPMTELFHYRADMILMRDVLQLILKDPILFLSETSSPYWAPELRPDDSEASHAG